MKSLTVLCLMIICFGNAPAHQGTGTSAAGAPPLFVTPAWLAAHLNDPGVVVLHVAQNRREYASGHIPGAQFLWHGWLALSNPEYSYEILPVASLDTTLERLGISNTSRIILYGSGSQMTITARMYVTLDYLGLGAQTSILDGGLGAWTAGGHPASTETPPAPARGALTPQLQPESLAGADWINANLTTPGVAIVDARAPEFYTGTPGNNRSGHIPGAVNIPFSSVADSANKMKSPDSLRAIFAAAGVKPGDRVISYCHVGQQASLIYVAAKYLGYQASLFDGSWDEWGIRNELPVETPAKKDSTTK